MIYLMGMLLVAMVLAAFVVPVIRSTPDVVSHSDSAQVMLNDQLSEVERDVSRGLVSPEDGQAATLKFNAELLPLTAKQH